MSLEQDLLNLYTSNKDLDTENARLRDELAATRRESSAALAAAQGGFVKKANEPPSSAPAAPTPAPLPPNAAAFVKLPVATQEKLRAERGSEVDLLFEQPGRVRLSSPYFGPGETRPDYSGPPDIRLGEETRLRHAAVVKRAFVGMPDFSTTQNGPTPKTHFIPTAPPSARKIAGTSAAKR
jgi:hypothetical protein